jgi:hypothetical protein
VRNHLVEEHLVDPDHCNCNNCSSEAIFPGRDAGPSG